MTLAKRVNERKDLWKLRVVPDSTADVFILLPPTTDCAATGAVCTADDRMLAVGGGVQVPGPVPGGLLRKALRHGPDAEYQTDSGHTLVFPVSAQTSAVRTALALHNPGATVLVVQCAFQTADSVLATVDLELDARGQETGFVDEWFPEMPESGGAVRCTAERRFTGVAVEMDTDSGLFTSLLGKAPAAP